ncbi:hypothetical protein A3B42_03925 [Candidatus Daviesbacteria bacterium RIFCSPLOWO2_01_FULL_38_10]|nr:MAG: hypothetical protein A3B42_03925 [Candidatus Daviesbacteria bacterium RIFCSPLOWO2_01_FULL_38_10]OGE44753.1 MAG: hypothetical protein A3E67_02110 [Candidatus Daviesbacteria bacterium RIFCSPHIGHO2_12_FULL_38_25]OGE68325.1 MAG: hypothetical protein A3H81_06075 [Candidatus Daviesbacteria bacterium RIFCSPLOWO2_02_FULL_38_18]HBQ50385.1 hypothetical protein [Candidatus Daviesbacteria bacterium]HCB22557.1 hypothetical protein [Candidatus Daviesbacteria bacterium]
MLAKVNEREKAIYLRQQGKSYSEIMLLIPVSQSSLSLWLRDVVLTDEQRKRLLLKKQIGQAEGGRVKRRFRELKETKTINVAKKAIGKLSKREIWLLGIIAYWCEGSKQRKGNISQGVAFANSDPFLIRLFIRWVKEFCQIKDEDISFNLYIHKTGNIPSALDFWGGRLGIEARDFGKTYIKNHNVLTKRKNTGEDYHGLIRVGIKKSTDLNRKIKGWVIGMNNFV